MKAILATFTLLLACSFHLTAAVVLANWNFNTYNGSDGTIGASLGAGSLTINGFAGAGHAVQAGTTVNVLPPAPAGSALALINSANNGRSITLKVSSVDFVDLVLTYAARRTATGFTTHQWAWSTDNSVFNNLAPVAVGGSGDPFLAYTLNLSAIAAIENQPQVYLRDTLTGATSSSGNNRFDNVTISAVPEPAVGLWLAGAVLPVLAFRWVRSRR